MIKNQKLWQDWEKELLRKTRADWVQNLRLLEAMFEEARGFGIFPPRDPLEGLDEKIRWIQALHVSKTS